MGNIAQIIVNVTAKTVNKPYSYYIPDNLQFIQKGYRVIVPFGPRQIEGFVIDVIDGDIANLKPIIGVLDDYPWFDENMLKTADWVSKFYLTTQAEAFRLFVPGKTGVKTESKYYVHDDLSLNQALEFLTSKTEQYRRVFLFIAERGSSHLTQLKKHFGSNVLKILNYLTNNNLIRKETVAHSTKQIKYQNTIMLAVDTMTAQAKILELRRRPAQQRLLDLLIEKQSLSARDLKDENVSPNTVKKLIATGIAKIVKIQVLRNSYAQFSKGNTDLTLTSEQQYCVNSINKAIQTNKFKSFLVHGITGSGKTQVYIEAVAEARRNNRQSIVLVPEIALTGQIVSRFKEKFGDDVVVIHSKLSIAERYDAWQKLRTNQAGIAIGVRSAIFAPLVNLGLIILDEEHEFTYKQEESPRYHARQVAEIRARLANATLVLGSATPSVETYYKAMLDKHTLLTIKNRIDGSRLPEVEVVDMRQELRLGRRSILSYSLQQLLKQTITNREQAILLLNRRGYATFVLCRECGYVMKCSHCSTSLVYHNDNNNLRCHYCQSVHHVPDICPECSSRYIRYFGTGTQRLEEELIKLWPTIRVVRMDQDTTNGKLSHLRILNDFADGKYDILLGTQMVAKGHDIKNVTAVGIIAADATLNIPDFRSAERTFALLTQAAGRAGRGNKPGKVIIQTYNPDHYAIKAGTKHDYHAFYQTEISYRKELFYPPFSQIIKLTITANDERQLHLQGECITNQLRNVLNTEPNTKIIGPFKAAVFKIKDSFRLNILIKTTRLSIVRHYLNSLCISDIPNVHIDIEPVSLM